MTSCFKCNTACVFKDVTKSKDTKDLFGGPCDLCRKILCRSCSGISASEIRAFTAQTRVMSYYCSDCLEAVRNAINELPKMGEVLNLEKQVADIRNDLEEVKVGIAATSRSYADVLQIKTDAEVLKGNVVKLEDKVESIKSQKTRSSSGEQGVEPAFEEMMERERRSANILVFGVTESDKQNRGERIEGELNTVKDILQRINVTVSDSEVSIHRLGKYDPEKVRPVKVTFATKDLARKVLRQKHRLDNTGGVYIKSDQTQMQRKFLSNLLAELKVRNDQGETNIKIKYINSIPKIIKVRERQPKN